MSKKKRIGILIGVSLLALAIALSAPRIAQDPQYHGFADQADLFGVPNALNIFSNLLFLGVGLAGLRVLRRSNALHIVDDIRPAYLGFFAALVLVSAGSTFYHWSPDNFSLAWDRLAMVLAFMSFLTILLAERVSTRAAQRMFPWLLLCGVASIVYWQLSEQAGAGDLRPYALLQFLPILLTPLILLGFDARYTRASDLWWLLAWYLFAKLFEVYDHEIYRWLGVISGHSLKHLAAGVGCLVFLRHLRSREPVGQ